MVPRPPVYEPPYSPAQAAQALGISRSGVCAELKRDWLAQGRGRRLVTGRWAGTWREGTYWKIPPEVVRHLRYGTPRDAAPHPAVPCPDCAQLRAAFAAFAASLSTALTHLQTVTAASGGAAPALPTPPYPQPRSGSQATTQ